MPSNQFGPPLADVVPERDSRVVRCYAEHLKGLGLSAGTIRKLINTARHIVVWLALDGPGLDKFDIRLLDLFMCHECHCPGWPRSARRPVQQCRRFAIRFLRHLLETGWAEVPPEIEAGGHLAVQFRGSSAGPGSLPVPTAPDQCFGFFTAFLVDQGCRPGAGGSPTPCATRRTSRCIPALATTASQPQGHVHRTIRTAHSHAASGSRRRPGGV